MKFSRLSSLTLGFAIAVFALGYSPSFADKPECGMNANEHCTHGDHAGGDSGGNGKDALYSAIITGPGGTNMNAPVLGGNGDPDWHGNFGGKTRIGLNTGGSSADSDTNVGDLNMGFFITKFGSGDNCFGADEDTVFFGQALLKSGKHGRAEASFWFPALAIDEDTEVGYLLTMIGEEDDAFSDVWPPSGTTTMKLDTWKLSAGNESAAVRDISCLDAGVFGNDVVEIEVTRLDP